MTEVKCGGEYKNFGVTSGRVIEKLTGLLPDFVHIEGQRPRISKQTEIDKSYGLSGIGIIPPV